MHEETGASEERKKAEALSKQHLDEFKTVCDIIKTHGGTIWLESKVDKGSTFTFTLPIDRSTNR